jgi:O-antigen ligase/tetratricopeptide (TPR) repeat protein
VSVAEHHHARVRRTHHQHPALRLAEGLLCALVVLLPLLIGGVHPPVLLGASVLGAIALGGVLVGRGGDGVVVPAAAVALLGAVLFSLLTVVPLPAAIVGWLSPKARWWAELPPDAAPLWIRLSLDAPATWLEVARLGGLIAILLAAATLARRPEPTRRLTKALALAGVAVALVSWLHMAAGVSQLYGVYPFRFVDWPLTTFINANHAASLALISTLAATGLSWSAQGWRTRLGWGVAALLGVALAVHTKSVAGITSLLLALVLFAVLTVQRRREVSRPLFALGAVLSLLAVSGIAIGIGGSELSGIIADSGASKLRPWGPTLQLIREHWLTGVGRGAFFAAYPPYAPPRSLTTVTHPENFVLQWLAEWGVPVALGVFAALGLTLWRAWRRRTGADEAAAVWHDALLAAVVGVLIHDLADFGLEFAGVGVPFIVALGLVAGRTAGAVRWRVGAWAIAGGAGVMAVGVAIFALPQLVDREIPALHARQQTLDVEGLNREYRALHQRHPADPMVVIDGSNALLHRFADATLPLPERLKSMDYALRFLSRAQELSQQDQPHLSLAWAFARLGRRSQAFTELRLAYAASMKASAIDQALTYEATPEELASFPVALARSRAKNPDGNLSFEPSHAAAVLVDYLANGPRRLQMARLTVAEVLRLPASEGVSHSSELLEAACRITYADGECARAKQPGCSAVEQIPAIEQQLLAMGGEWMKLAPKEPKAYACLASGHILREDDAEVQRTLSEAAAMFPEAPSLKLFLAQWHLRQGRPEASVEALSKIAGDGDDLIAAGVRSTRVRALWASGKKVAAKSEAESAVRLYPDALWAYELAAGVHQVSGQPELAVQALLNAERLASGEERARLAAWREKLQETQAAPKAVDPAAFARP